MTRLTYSEALDELEFAQKPRKGPAYTRYINRRLGRILAAASYRIGLTPNAVSLISFAFSLCGLILAGAFRPTPASGLVVAFLLAFGYALDSADGQVARLTDTSSRTGEWLDHVLDCAKITLFHLTILVVFYRFYAIENPVWYLIPMAFLLVNNLMFFGGILADQFKRSLAKDSARALGAEIYAPRNALKSVLMLPVDYGVLVWGLVTLSASTFYTNLYLGLLLLNVPFLIAYFWTWLREIR